jgi:hypothetical protein
MKIIAAVVTLAVMPMGCEEEKPGLCLGTGSEELTAEELDELVPEWRETVQALEGVHSGRLYLDDDLELDATPPDAFVRVALRIEIEEGAELSHFECGGPDLSMLGEPTNARTYFADLRAEDVAALHQVLPQTAGETTFSQWLHLGGPVRVSMGEPICSGHFLAARVGETDPASDVVAEFVCDD